MALGVFVLGGAASGKSSLVRERYVGTLDLHAVGDPSVEHPRDGFSLDRWFNADNEKFNVPLYTDREGDEESLRRFGKQGLGGPTGPRTPKELAEYPQDVLDALQAFVERLGFVSVEHFAGEMLMDEEGQGPLHFRRGLTHELSKYIAETKFEEQLEVGPEERAAERRRRLPTSEVERTHAKAAKAADDLEIMAGTHPLGDRVTFERVPTSSEGEEMQAMEAGFGESSG